MLLLPYNQFQCKKITVDSYRYFHYFILPIGRISPLNSILCKFEFYSITSVTFIIWTYFIFKGNCYIRFTLV